MNQPVERPAELPIDTPPPLPLGPSPIPAPDDEPIIHVPPPVRT